ncbi:uncharacterized protein [Acropora muricata]|uniref:uncharacterized protein LOC114964454 n=1 Tax=Acropora millepora TaxID=45264 RepID=UPI0010FCB20E|nr:uncharacterized protein LOC114964454 [Acropora millepora]XP_029199622.1 uncharacterized protein LOC114964454 [Acropora millepora]
MNSDKQREAQGGPVSYSMNLQRAPLREEPPNDHRILSIVSIFFCPLLGFLALLMSYVTNQRYEADEMKRAQDASKDARFSAILAIIFGCSIVFFCIFIFTIVPVLGD